MGSSGDITRALEALEDGDADAFHRLVPLVYDELHSLADQKMLGERPDHTLQPTALVNEAYLRLLDQFPNSWRNRGHFLAAAAQAMRHILIDHARKRASKKRGAGWKKVSAEGVGVFGENSVDLLDLDAALQKLAERYPKKARVVELRIFGGLTVNEVAELLGITTKTVERHWTFAKAWLGRALGAGDLL